MPWIMFLFFFFSERLYGCVVMRQRTSQPHALHLQMSSGEKLNSNVNNGCEHWQSSTWPSESQLDLVTVGCEDYYCPML